VVPSIGVAALARSTKRTEARDLVAPIYGGLTEGLDTLPTGCQGTARRAGVMFTLQRCGSDATPAIVLEGHQIVQGASGDFDWCDR
jgi:hypothetical protein